MNIRLTGHGGVGPNFWKWFIAPGALYLLERVLRVYRAKQKVVLLSVRLACSALSSTLIAVAATQAVYLKPNVFSLEFAKEGVFADPYKVHSLAL